MTETEKGQRRKKIPPTPGFEPQVTQCLVGATLTSPSGGMDWTTMQRSTHNKRTK